MAHGPDINGFTTVSHSDLGGFGDGMQIARNGDALYVGHSGTTGMGTSILDISDLSTPRVVRQFRSPDGGHCHKAVHADGILLTNHEGFQGGTIERPGMAVYDTSDPFDPKEIGFWNSTGMGVHRIYYPGGPYVYSVGDARRLLGADLVRHRCERPTLTRTKLDAGGGRAWPTTREAEWPANENRSVHHALVNGDRAYMGLWGSGMAILDIADISVPQALVPPHLGSRRAHPHLHAAPGPGPAGCDRRSGEGRERGRSPHGADHRHLR